MSAPPEDLLATQKWFANVITKPLGHTHEFEEEAGQFITPSPTLQPWQRIQIYNQQYWWRLLKILQDVYPTLTRLFGPHDFDEGLAVPYMQKYPSQHWAIDMIGNHLPQWILDEYNEDDKALIYEVASVDLAFTLSFFCDRDPPINAVDETIVQQTLYLQPHLYLFALQHDLFPFRKKLLEKEPDYWLENPFPELSSDTTYYYAVSNGGEVQTLNPVAYQILLQFEKGASIEGACEWLDFQPPPIKQQATAKLHLWFQEWTARQWLSFEKKSS